MNYTLTTTTTSENIMTKELVSETFLEYFWNKYPELNGDSKFAYGFRNFLMHLAFSPFLDHESGKIVINHTLILKCCGKIGNHNFRSGDFLQSFRDKVLPNLSWADYIPPTNDDWETSDLGGMPRLVNTTGFDQEDQNMIVKELAFEGKKFYFRDGKAWTGKIQRQERVNISEEYDEMSKQFNLNEVQKLIIDVFSANSTNARAIAAKINENRLYISRAIDNMQLDDDDKISLDEKKKLQYKIIAGIEEDPRIFYQPSAANRTARLDKWGENIMSLQRDVRKAACIGWYEADLRSSQFVILSNILKAKQAISLIKENKSIWNTFNLIVRGEYAKPSQKDKNVFKRFIYSLCFGMSIDNLKECLLDANAEKLLENSMIQELLHRRDQYLEHIKKQRQITDVWGNIHNMEKAKIINNWDGRKKAVKSRWQGSLLGTKIQSIELQIISYAYRCSQDLKCLMPQYQQHDGFTFSIQNKSEITNYISKLKQSIKDGAKELSEATNVDFTDMALDIEEIVAPDNKTNYNDIILGDDGRFGNIDWSSMFSKGV